MTYLEKWNKEHTPLLIDDFVKMCYESSCYDCPAELYCRNDYSQHKSCTDILYKWAETEVDNVART